MTFTYILHTYIGNQELDIIHSTAYKQQIHWIFSKNKSRTVYFEKNLAKQKCSVNFCIFLLKHKTSACFHHTSWFTHAKQVSSFNIIIIFLHYLTSIVTCSPDPLPVTMVLVTLFSISTNERDIFNDLLKERITLNSRLINVRIVTWLFAPHVGQFLQLLHPFIAGLIHCLPPVKEIKVSYPMAGCLRKTWTRIC